MKQKQTTPQNTKTIPITHSLRPAYYDDFQCLAQDCKFTCCTGWKITMNRKNYLTVRDQHGSALLNQQIKQALHKIKQKPTEEAYAEIRCNANGFCPMLTEDHLCRLQMECGYPILPDVCKVFPRNKYYRSSGFLEESLSISCEVVLELLWNLPEGIDFIADALPKEQQGIVSFDHDSPHIHFQEVRSLCIDFLQDRRFSLGQRILLMGFFLQKFPENYEDIPDWLTQTQAAWMQPNIVELCDTFMQSNENFANICLLQNIKTLMNPKMRSHNKQLEEYRLGILHSFLVNFEEHDNNEYDLTTDFALYEQCKQNFYDAFGDIEYFFENLAVSIFFSQAYPSFHSKEILWKDYVNFCNIYSLLRFIAITSCRKLVPNQKEVLFEAILFVARTLIHSPITQKSLNDLFFENESSSLAHMAVLLSQ